jgi:adenylate cyclase
LPERWKRNRRRAALSCLAVVTLLVALLHPHGGADELDGWWLRARFSLREMLFGVQKDARFALVEIDDKSLAAWNDEPLLFWGGHMADAINHLTRSGAQVIALDWTQTVETDEKFKWDNDQRLGAALMQAKNVVWVKMIKPAGGYVLPTESLRFATPGEVLNEGSSLGYADFPTLTGVQTAFYPTVAATQGHDVSFAQRIVQKAASKVPAAPLREDGSLLINFANGAGQRGALSPFERASLSDVAASGAQNAPPDARWNGKIVIIGATYKGSNDFHFVPFLEGMGGARLIAGMEVQAHAARTILQGNGLVEPPDMAVALLAGVLGALGVGAFALLHWGRAALATLGVALLWGALSFALFAFANCHLPLAVPLLSLLFGAALMGGYRGLSEERERAQVMKIWGRHQDPRLIEVLLANPEWRSGQGREVPVTVLFADLKNFTKTVESLPPAQALQALNRYLSLLSATIIEHGGVVDKYLGDGLMAQWGAPAPRDDHASGAVSACLDIQKRLRALTPELQAAGEVTFEVRLTLHSGPVVAGPLGSENRQEYTIIGDTVNVTSRLQETAKELGCDFLISETTLAEIATRDFQIGRESEVAIRGRQQPLRVFEVVSG